MSRTLAVATAVVVGLAALVILFSILWAQRQGSVSHTRWCTLFNLRDAVKQESQAKERLQLSHVSPPRAVRGPAYEAKQAEEMARFRRLHEDRAAIAPLKVPVWNVIFGRHPFSVELSEALHALTPRQFDMLRQWLLRNLPVRRTLAGEEVGNRPWTEVGTVRSQSSDLSSIHVAPLFAQRHKVEPRRFNYRIRFRDGNGGEAWVLLGDDDAQRDGLRWIRHGDAVQALDHTWTVFLGLQWRNRSL